MNRGKKKHAAASELSAGQRWRQWCADKIPVFIFGLKFGLLVVLLYVLLALPFFDRMLYAYLEANAWLSNILLHAFGQHTRVLNDVVISSPKFAIAIRRGCDAVEPTWLLCAAVVSFHASWRHKLLGMAAGIVFLQLLNLARIVSLYCIGIYFPAFFNSAHIEIWPTAFIAAAIFLFVGWIRWSSQHPPSHAAH